MRLVKDEVVPSLALENVGVSAGECVRGYANIEVVLVVPALTKLFASLGTSMIT